jgi:hypothetical protein
MDARVNENVTLKTVWRARDAAIERDVLAYWDREKALPPDADPAARLRELCVVANDGPSVVGSVEAHLHYVDFLCARLASLRLFVARSHRRGQVANTITLEAQHILERWSFEHPEEKLMGCGGATQAKNVGDWLRAAVLQPTGFALVNYNEKGEQFRLAWFKHATID